jgi:hypothetical protein
MKIRAGASITELYADALRLAEGGDLVFAALALFAATHDGFCGFGQRPLLGRGITV